MWQEEWVAVLDFGSQYAQLIARRVREAGVYSEIVPFDIASEALKARNPKGIILSGGPASILEPASPRPDEAVFHLGIPLLGICYGLQVGILPFGGKVEHAPDREYGNTPLILEKQDPLLSGVPASTTVWM